MMKVNRFAQLRDEAGMTQEQLAERLGYTNSQTISTWELGTRQPKTETLERLADMYETSVDYLLGRTSIREPYPKTSEETEKPETSGDHDKIMAVLKETGLLDLLAAARKIGFTPDRREDAQ